ncbi:hypothetical protein [Yinghuangia seranimata]|uniref:hypothetical protein n=1 Tax=Yinghuangia seranimata TaxID=408067 RepID=UPI00248B92C1|nr:hypothetical protein [Yinghuangia seranimata]MDI2129566.1 hypothetical protein [Yinghuangia seranimata]
MIEVTNTGAFSVNCVGLERAPFPLSFSATRDADLWTVTAAAAQAREIADLLPRTDDRMAVVVNLASNTYLDEGYQPWSPSRIARDLGIDCGVHRFSGWEEGCWEVSEELLVMPYDQLTVFLDGVTPYELSITDVPHTITPEAFDTLALTIATAKPPEPILPALLNSHAWLSMHDDCYTLLETTDPTLPPRLLTRLLTLLAGQTLTTTATPTTHLPEPPPALATTLLTHNPHWLGTTTPAPPTTIRIALTALPTPWRLGDTSPTPDCIATFDTTTSTWQLTDA